MVNIIIDGIKLSVEDNTKILDVATFAGIHIPTLCYLKNLNEIGACRVCVVEVEGYDRLLAACNTVVEEGMVIHTNTKKVLDARKMNIELILAEHNVECTTCIRSGNCSLQKVANDLGVKKYNYKKSLPKQKNYGDFPLVRDYTKCIKCMRCVQVCDKIQNSHIWGVVNTGAHTTVDVKDVYDIRDSKCVICGQCITHCPVGALTERDDTDKVFSAIADKDKITIVQMAPAIRTAWGEEFGMDAKEATVERLCTALKMMGVDYVFDTNFSADLTIMEEGSEFLERLKNKEKSKFPMFTSCCPGWVRFIKGHYPELVDNLSTAKSPQQMFGAVAKSYYAKILNVDPKKIFVISIMPCLAKKHECAIPTMNDACGEQDVDIALTVREVVRMIKASNISPKEIKDTQLDMPLGVGSGAGNIFGATGGVMEAALRTAYYLVVGKNPDPDLFKDVRGMDGWKEATFDLNGAKIRVAVANGLANADKLIKAIKNKEVEYDFVEIMACPGGCVGGGGQPIHNGEFYAPERANVLYFQDKNMKLRFCHENPSIIDIYKNYLTKPLSEKSHHLLHTNHHAWKMPNEE